MVILLPALVHYKGFFANQVPLGHKYLEVTEWTSIPGDLAAEASTLQSPPAFTPYLLRWGHGGKVMEEQILSSPVLFSIGIT